MNSVSTVPEATTAYEKAPAPSAKMGMWWFLASEIMLFGGLIGSYILYRLASGGAWTELAHHISTPIGAINTFVLLTSSFTMVKAHECVMKENHRGTRNFLAYTVGLGLLFLGIKAFEYSMEIAQGYTPVSGMFWSFYYTMTGLHALHVFAGVVVNFLLLLRAWRGSLWPQAQHRVEIAGIYWHFVDIVWIFLFPLIYLSY